MLSLTSAARLIFRPVPGVTAAAAGAAYDDTHTPSGPTSTHSPEPVGVGDGEGDGAGDGTGPGDTGPVGTGPVGIGPGTGDGTGPGEACPPPGRRGAAPPGWLPDGLPPGTGPPAWPGWPGYRGSLLRDGPAAAATGGMSAGSGGLPGDGRTLMVTDASKK